MGLTTFLTTSPPELTQIWWRVTKTYEKVTLHKCDTTLTIFLTAFTSRADYLWSRVSTSPMSQHVPTFL